MYEGIVNIFRQIDDPRSGNAIDHDLAEVLTIAIISIICGAEYFTQMEVFGLEQIDQGNRFRENMRFLQLATCSKG